MTSLFPCTLQFHKLYHKLEVDTLLLSVCFIRITCALFCLQVPFKKLTSICIRELYFLFYFTGTSLSYFMYFMMYFILDMRIHLF